MDKDLRFERHFREATIQQKDAATLRFGRSVLQLFGTRERGDRIFPVSAGTAMLLKVGSREFLVTAAHVLDQAKSSTLYVGVAGKLEVLEGTAFVTHAKNRDDDVYDFGFMEVPESIRSLLPPDSFIERDRFYYGKRDALRPTFMAIGFPRSKNKTVDIPRRRMRNRRWSYTARPARFDFAAHGASPTSHLAITYEPRRCVNDAGARSNPLYPRGLSGGPLCVLGNAADANYYRNYRDQALLAGVCLELFETEKAFLAVRLVVVLQSIAEHFPDVAPSLPGEVIKSP